MKTILSALALSAAMTGAASAEDMYLKVFGGAALSPDLEWESLDYEMDTGYSAGAALGWNLSGGFALEGEVAYHESGYSCCNSDASLLNLSVNGIYTFGSSETLKPYVGAGLGYGQINYDGSAIGEGTGEDWVFTYQVMAGVRAPVATNTELVAEYRYIGAEEGEDNGLNWEYSAHVLSAGLRFNF